MPVDNFEAQENNTETRSHLFFHGTENPHAKKSMPKYGLLATKDTLAPDLEVAFGFMAWSETTANNLLTFWYPQKAEVKIPGTYASIPTQLFPENTRYKAIEDLSRSLPENTRLEKIYKRNLLRMVQEATTYLPSSRLAAIASLTENEIETLQSYLHTDFDPLGEMPEDILMSYSLRKEEYIHGLEEILKNTEIKFFDPAIDIRILARDIVKRNLEHHLLLTGEKLTSLKKKCMSEQSYKFHRNVLARNLQILQRVTFDVPTYERYRKILVSGIRNFLQGSSSSTKIEGMVTAGNKS